MNRQIIIISNELELEDYFRGFFKRMTSEAEKSINPDERIDEVECERLTGWKKGTQAQKRHKKEIPFFRIGKKILYLRSDIEQIISEKRVLSKSEVLSMAKQMQHKIK